MHPAILVPIDGSPFSEQALPTALAIARRTGARVHLVQVHEPWIAAPPFAELPPYDPVWERGIREQESLYLDELADRCREDAGVDVHAEVIDGPVADALAGYAAEVNVELIVMTTHGRGGFSRLWLGSVADGLVRKATRPVLLLRPDDEPVDPTDTARAPALDHVLVPIDGSEFSKQVIGRAIALGKPLGARFTLLRVISPAFAPGWPHQPPPLPTPPDLARERARAEESLEMIAEGLRAQKLRVKTAVVIHTRPAVGIIEFARDGGVDLIAMTTHGRGGWSRVALGSVADKVLRGTSTPLVLYRPVGRGPRPVGSGAHAVVEEGERHGLDATAAHS